MIKINEDFSEDVKYFLSGMDFKKIYSRTWNLPTHFRFNDSAVVMLEIYLNEHDIDYDIHIPHVGTLASASITFGTNEDELHFIMLINSLKS
jgi:hypothetical protein